MKYAVVKTGGKQYKITEGDIVEIEKLADDTKEITFGDVLLYTADGVVKVGNPLVSGITIKGTVLGETRGKKIRVAKYKAKVRYRRVTGHRATFSQVKINSIEAQTEKKAANSPETEKKTGKKAVK